MRCAPAATAPARPTAPPGPATSPGAAILAASRSPATRRRLRCTKAHLAVRQSVDLRAPRWWRLDGPSLATVQTAIDLSTVGGARHAQGLPLVKCQLEHRVRRLHAHIDAAPAVAAIGAVEQHPQVALEVGARRHPQFTRITRHLV